MDAVCDKARETGPKTFEVICRMFDDAKVNLPLLPRQMVVCKIKIEEIEEPLMKQIRYLDKLVDELAKGKSIEKIK